MNKVLNYGLLLLLSIPVLAQQSAIYTDELADFQHAVNLYNSKSYQASQTLFANIKNTTSSPALESDCAYYIAHAAIRLNQPSAEVMMEQFVEDYPTSPRKNTAYLEVGNFYFETGKYPQAIKWLDKVNENTLSYSERDRYYFQKGYGYFQAKNRKEAENYLNRVAASPEYGSQAKYYLGYMAYEGDDYGTANVYFESIENDRHYSENLSYYQADMNFKQGNFEEAIALAKNQLERANTEEKSQLSKIIGESYFNLKEYQAAIPYLKAYRGTRGKWNNTDYYQLGYAYYMQQDYKNAITEFNKIISGRDAIAQNAYYHLGDAYLQQNQKQQALNAFKNASEMEFSATIQEDAFYNYAKLSYEIGNIYTSVPGVISGYLEKYPNTYYRTQLEDLLIDSYISSKNYQAAYDLLLKNPKFEHRESLQIVRFYLGIEALHNANLAEASRYLEEALRENVNPYYHAKATYWNAEVDYRLGNYDVAYLGFQRFKQQPGYQQLEENNNLNYNIGYTLFKNKNYKDAIGFFDAFLKQKGLAPEMIKDAHLRLADSYFMNSQYWPAMESYNHVIAAGGAQSDYAAFQKAICYGVVDRVNNKIEDLLEFDKKYVNSSYRGQALYELATTYLSQKDHQKALETYDQLIQGLPNHSLVSKALLRKGLIYYNNNQSEQALTQFKRVAASFPDTPDAIQAVKSAELIYKDLGRVNEYAAWVKTLDYVEITDVELDQATFEAAENRYFHNELDQAKVLLQNYLRDFPTAIHALTAHYYLAQIYFATDPVAAAPHLEEVVARPNNEFTDEALTKLSTIWLQQNDYQKVIPLLLRLENLSAREENLIFAQSNLMKSYYEIGDYQRSIAYCETVLENAQISREVKNDAWVFIARSSMKTGDENRAKSAYAEVLKTATGLLGAEALYHDAYFKHQAQAYQASNEQIQKLAKEYAAYKEWGGKGLIVMAKNFYALNDAFQATYILESVIQNFTDYPQIIAQAEGELHLIKQKEAQTNTSVRVD